MNEKKAGITRREALLGIGGMAAGAVLLSRPQPAWAAQMRPQVATLQGLTQNNFTGLASGTAVTTANSGGSSGSAFTWVGTGTGCSVTADSTHTAHGPMACKFVTGSGTDAYVQWDSAVIPSVTQSWFRFYAYFTANSGATTSLYNLIDSSQNKICTVALNSSGKVLLEYGAARTVAFTSVNSVPLNQWVRIEGSCTASAIDGQVSLETYFASMDAASTTETYTSGNLDTGSGTPDFYSFGTFYDAGSIGPYWLANLAVSSVGPIGPVNAEQPATGFAWFGAYPGSSNADPETYESDVAGRKLGCWYRYYAMNSNYNVPTSDDVTQAGGRILIMSLATSFSVPAGGCGETLQVSLASNGVALSSFTGSGVLNVSASPASNGYSVPSSGSSYALDIVLASGSVATVTYTGISGSSFTGCKTTAGSGTLATGNKMATQYSWAATANGAYDSQLTTIADNAKNLPNPWFLVWGHEPDVAASQFGTATDFIASYQHVSTLVRGICGTGMGAGNVVMAWVVSGYSGTLAASYYPGDAYADWLGMDPYDKTLTKGSPSATYTPMITWLNDDLMAVGGGSGSGGGHGKPLGIFETGVENPVGSGGTTTDAAIAAWIGQVPACLATLKTTWGSQFQLWQWWNASPYVIETDGTMPDSIEAMESIGADSSFTPPS